MKVAFLHMGKFDLSGVIEILLSQFFIFGAMFVGFSLWELIRLKKERLFFTA